MLQSPRTKVRSVLDELGIAPGLLRARGLVYYREAQRLAPVGLGTDGRDKLLTPDAARAWLALHARAHADGIPLLLVSAFRSVDYQLSLLRAKLARGLSIEDILKVNAPPGYSEHHTGRAVDVGVPGCAGLDEAFENTEAFAWLQREAGGFGFHLSYPRGNAQGYLYEPWHWCYRGTAPGGSRARATALPKNPAPPDAAAPA